jgi:hypothetical protein
MNKSEHEKLLAREIREIFDYSNGRLIWRSRPRHHFTTKSAARTFNTRFAGKAAGCVTSSSGYMNLTITLDGISKQYLVHRLIWLWHTGSLPKEVDHINHHKMDNRIENLRDVTHKNNSRNQSAPRSNTSGHMGVTAYKNNRWRVRVMIDGYSKHIGLFDTLDDAVIARDAFYREFRFHENHGQQKAPN